MNLQYHDTGRTMAWTANGGHWMVVAADAQTIVRMLESGDLHASWKLYGSPDQPDALLLAAHPSCAETDLMRLENPDGLLIAPDAEGWRLMTLDDVREFAPDDEPEGMAAP